MFHTAGTRSGLRKRPGTPASNGQVIYNLNGGLVGSNLTISSSGSLTGNGAGLTLLANNGIVSNSTGVFANLATAATTGLQFLSGGLAVKPDTAISVSATGTQVNTSGTSSGLSTTGGLNVVVANGLTLTTTGVNVLANNGILSNSTGVWAVTNTSQFVVTSGGITCNATGNLTIQDLWLQGNLTVMGTMTTINTTSMVVENNMIDMAYAQSNTTTFTDSVDSGFFTTWGNTTTSNTYWGGLARIHQGSSANLNPLFVLFATSTVANKPAATLPTYGNNFTNVGYLQAYLTPYTNASSTASQAFVVNATAIAITANSTLPVTITANAVTFGAITATSLSLTTQLAVSNIAGGTDGQVLQWFTGATSATYGMLDGGTF